MIRNLDLAINIAQQKQSDWEIVIEFLNHTSKQLQGGDISNAINRLKPDFEVYLRSWTYQAKSLQNSKVSSKKNMSDPPQ